MYSTVASFVSRGTAAVSSPAVMVRYVNHAKRMFGRTFRSRTGRYSIQPLMKNCVNTSAFSTPCSVSPW